MKNCALLLLCAAALSAQTGTWTRFATLQDARADACAVRVAPGQVLISGGSGSNGTLATAEILSADASVRAAAPMNAPRARHTCTLLNDGRVLVTGGGPDTGELYDPKSDAWTLIPGNGIARSGATATLLLDGRVLIAGGTANLEAGSTQHAKRHRTRSLPGAAVPALEIFDPVANLLLLAAELQYPRTDHAAALLPDGRVAIVGGDTGAGPLRSVEIFDPATSSVSAGPNLTIARAGHSATALEDGRVLVAGGTSGIVDTDTAEILGASAQSWTTLPQALHSARSGHVALLVPGNGGVLLAGGFAAGQAISSTELFQPADDSFQSLGNLTAPRSALSAAPLADGLVLAMGGATAGVPQSACGVLPLPALSFTAALYHPSETVRVSGSNFPANTTIPLILEQVQGSTVTSISSRLLTPTVTTGNSSNLLASFGPVNVVSVAGGDAGKQFRVSIRVTSSASISRTVPAKLATTISIPLPPSVLEGGFATFPIEIQRLTLPGPVSGSLTTTFGTSTVVTALSGSTTPTVANLTRTNLAAGPLPITATYSGDSLSDTSTASATYNVVSKTPSIDLKSSTLTPQVGVPFTLTATVKLSAPVSNAPGMTGILQILESGIAVGTATITTTGAPNPTLTATLPFTALSFAPLHFTATFAGDPVYRAVTSATVSPVQQKAQTAISLVPPPLLPFLEQSGAVAFQCGVASSYLGTLTFPAAIGLINRAFSVNSTAADGSVRFVSTTPNGTLVPSTTTGVAQGSASLTLPFNATSLVASFSGDAFLQPSTSPLFHVAMQPVPMSVQIAPLPATVANPVIVKVTVANNVPSTCALNGPQGTVQIFDGGSNLGILPLPSNTVTPTQILDGTSNTILIGEINKQVSLTLSLPVGVHNLKARYNGDTFHAATDSPVVTVTVQ